ncbi:putative allantoate permease [Cadophora sp. DSE1049]|nr:putative allantoate permease [Cadophora sp. DSE1049]
MDKVVSKTSVEDGNFQNTEVPVDDLSPAMNKRLRLKTDLVILPLIVITSTLAFLDKNGMAYAAVYGMRKDTHLVGQQYSWLGSIFYFGYLFAEFPVLWLLTKVPIGKYIALCLFSWGGVLCCMAACHNFAGLAAVRFILGVLEAGILPCLMIVNSIWYTREEQPLRTALWYNTFAGIFGGILSYAIGKMSAPLATWQYIFLIYGAVTMGFGILLFFALPDAPSKAWFFNAEEKRAAVVRAAKNQTGVKTQQKWKLAQVLEALSDPKYYCVAIFVIAQSITNAGITNFNPLIIAGYGFSAPKTTLMATPQAAIALVAQVICTAITFYIPNIRCLLWTLSCLPALAGAVMIHTLDIEAHRSASLAGVYLMGFYNVPWVLMLSLQSSNTAGMTKKSFVSVSIAVFYAVGNIIGPQFFRTDQAPHYPLGIGAMLCCFAIMTATGVLYWVLIVVENERRDAAYGKPGENAIVTGLEIDEQDRTDRENKEFRYVC